MAAPKTIINVIANQPQPPPPHMWLSFQSAITPTKGSMPCMGHTSRLSELFVSP